MVFGILLATCGKWLAADNQTLCAALKRHYRDITTIAASKWVSRAVSAGVLERISPRVYRAAREAFDA